MRKWNPGSRSWPAVLSAVAVLGAGLLAVGSVGTQAAAASSKPRIDGGVEDGTFKPTCLSGAPAPDTGVLQATHYRNSLGDVVRILVPYDIATNRVPTEFQCLQSYLVDAAQYGARVEVSLNRIAADAPGPSLAAYTTAVDDLASSEGGRISYLTAWNEPNNPHYLPGSNAATQAGQYFLAARKAFPGKMVAGDFASGVSPSFLARYIAAIGSARPGIWAIHPYTDVTNFQYYMHAGMSARQAGAKAAGNSKVLQLARNLHTYHYGSGTRIWLNEIYVDHKADKNPPAGVQGKKGVTGFSRINQAYAALFLSGGLGTDSLPGALAGKNLPQLTRYIYLRALDNTASDKQLPDARVLQVHFPDCLYYTLAGTKSTPAPQCS